MRVKLMKLPWTVEPEPAAAPAPCPSRGLTLAEFKEAGHLAAALEFMASHKGIRVHLVCDGEGFGLQGAGIAVAILRYARAEIECRLRELGWEEPA